MTKIAIIGIGRVGSTTAFCLQIKLPTNALTLIDRNLAKAEGLKFDLIGSFPQNADKIQVGKYENANDADIIVITAGAFGAPSGSSLWTLNKPIIVDIFSKIKPKKSCKIIIITTPCDRTVHLAQNLTGLDSGNFIGFGGQLDVNRLKYLISNDRKNFSKTIDATFIGEHGKRGIPVFSEPVSNKNKIINDTRNFFSTYLSEYNASTYGTASEICTLVEALLSAQGEVLTVSYYEPKHGIFVTWPCRVNKSGIKPIELELSSEEQKELAILIENRKKE